MSVHSYEDLLRINHSLGNALIRLEKKVEALERKLEDERTGGIEVTCALCERDVPQVRAVSPSGQGIWFCWVCDDELTRGKARHLIEEASAGDAG